MAKPREIEQRMLATHVGTPWRYRTLASKARTRAMWIVGIAWIAIGIGALAFLAGFFGSASGT